MRALRIDVMSKVFSTRFAMTTALSLALLETASCLGDDRRTGPANTPQPAGEVASSGDAKVDGILDRLEVKGQAIKGLQCKLVYKYVTVDPVEDEQVKEGELLFARADPNSRFLIVFKKLRAAGIERDTAEYYSFDGRWLTERNDKAKTIKKTEIARSGERTDPFKIGKGPFPLPFGQKRDDILKNFRVELADFTLGDPRNTDHLHCIPNTNTELADKYSRVEIYVDRTLELPVRIVTENIKDGNRIEVDFKDVDGGAAPAGSRFTIDEPKDFYVEVNPMSAQPTATQPGKQDG